MCVEERGARDRWRREEESEGERVGGAPLST